jgi:disulfide bond formation protein DsbB
MTVMLNGREMSFLLRPRTLFAAVFIACLGVLGFALYLQHGEVLEPCPMCILQRYAFSLIGLIAAIGAIHNPRRMGTMAYSALLFVAAVTGGGISMRHSWLQRFPTKSFSCGADLEYLLNTFPLGKALPAIFEGTGECSRVQWRLLGLSVPEWALVWFAIFAIVAVVVFLRARRAPRLP